MTDCMFCKKPIRLWQSKTIINHPLFAVLPEFLSNNWAHTTCLVYQLYDRISNINDELKVVNSFFGMQRNGCVHTLVKFGDDHVVLEHDEKADLNKLINDVIFDYFKWRESIDQDTEEPVDLSSIPDSIWNKHRINIVNPLMEFFEFRK